MALAFQLRYYIVSLSFLPFILNQTQDGALYYCVDWDCQEFISRGKTLLGYVGKTDKHLSFRQNEDIKILSKPVDDNGPDWVGSVRRKVGLVPKSMVREDQMGKHISKFRFPLNQLAFWSTPNIETVIDENTVNQTGIEQTATVANKVEDIASKIEVENLEDIQTTKSVEDVPTTTEGTRKEVEEIATTTEANKTEVEDIATTIEANKMEVEDIATTSEANKTEVEDFATTTEATKTEVEDITTTTEATKTEVDVPTTTEGTKMEVEDIATTTEANKTEVEDFATTTEATKAEVEDVPTTTEGTKMEVEDITTTTEAMKTEVEDITTTTEAMKTEVEDVPTSTEATKKEVEDIATTTVATKPGVEDIATTTDANKPEVEDIATTTEATKTDVEDVATTTEVYGNDELTTEMYPPLDSTIFEETAKQIRNDGEVAPLGTTTEAEDGSTSTETTKTEVEDVSIPVEEIKTEVDDVATEIYGNDELNTPISPPQDSITLEEATKQSGNDREVPVGTATEVEDIPSITEAPKTEVEVVDVAITTEETKIEVEDITTTTEAYDNDELTTPMSPTQDSITLEETAKQSRNDGEVNEHDHDHHHHHHHHHNRGHSHTHDDKLDAESSSFIVIVKHISSTLLSFLPEHLQDTVLDVDDALVFTGIIALTLISICVPYFLIEGFFSVRPLKKKVVELNKSLWKVSTAYENQQEEFEIYKTKALAFDEDKKRVEQLEYELVLLQKLESKQKEQVTKYQKELKTHKELTTDMQSFLDKEVEKKKKILEEKDKLKTTVSSLKEALRRTTDELHDAKEESENISMDYELSKQSNETLTMKTSLLEKEVNELKAKLLSEVERRRAAEDERDEVTKASVTVDNELLELKKICMKYEETVSNLNTEINHRENELMALKETLGEDSPLIDIAEVQGKLLNAEEESNSLQSRVESLTLENSSLSRNLKEVTGSLSSIQKERDDVVNRLQVLEAWFKEKEEDLRKAVERYEAEKNIRGKDKDELVRMIEEKGEENNQLTTQLEAFKEEFEETKQQHRNEMRTLEAKSHESWLSLCQAERKAQDARKEAEFLRQKLTSLSKERDGENEELNGDMSNYPLITPDMVPLPLPDDSAPSYFGLGDGFMPPPPLPLDGEREPHRPAPLGRLSPNYSDLDDMMLSPIRHGARGEDYSDGDSSESDSPRRRRSPRGGWVDVQHERDRNRDIDDRRKRSGPLASSPIHQGFNL